MQRHERTGPPLGARGFVCCLEQVLVSTLKFKKFRLKEVEWVDLYAEPLAKVITRVKMGSIFLTNPADPPFLPNAGMAGSES